MVAEPIKLPLNNNQLEAFELLVRVSLCLNKPIKIQGKLLWLLVDKLGDKLATRLKQIQRDSKTAKHFQLSAVEAMAFYEWYNAIRESMQAPYQYECIVADTIIRQIDQHYA